MDNSRLFNETELKELNDAKPLSKKAENGSLPEYLSIKEICDFLFPVPKWNTKPKEQSKLLEWREDCREKKQRHKKFKKKLINACKNNELIFEGEIGGWEYYGVNPHPLSRDGAREIFIPEPNREFYFDYRDIPGKERPKKYTCTVDHCTIHKEVFKSYLQTIKAWPITGKLAGWWVDDKMINRTDKRIERILEVINQLKINPMEIPEGNKQKIKNECLKDTELFNDSGFDRAWKEATNPKKEGNKQVIRMKDKEKYLKNQL